MWPAVHRPGLLEDDVDVWLEEQKRRSRTTPTPQPLLGGEAQALPETSSHEASIDTTSKEHGHPQSHRAIQSAKSSARAKSTKPRRPATALATSQASSLSDALEQALNLSQLGHKSSRWCQAALRVHRRMFYENLVHLDKAPVVPVEQEALTSRWQNLYEHESLLKEARQHSASLRPSPNTARMTSRPQSAAIRGRASTGKRRPVTASQRRKVDEFYEDKQEDLNKKYNLVERDLDAIRHLMEDLHMYDRDPSAGLDPTQPRYESAEHLSLDLFIDPNEDDVAPSYWLSLGRDRGLPGTPAVSHFADPNDQNGNFKWHWAKCYVLEYSPSRRQYLVQWDESVFPGGHRKWARRHVLRFEEEDEVAFIKMVNNAIQARRKFEAERRFDWNIEQQRDGTDCLEGETKRKAQRDRERRQFYAFPKRYPQDLKERIMILLPKTLSSWHPDVLDRCFSELEKEYIFSMKKTWFTWHVKDQNQIHPALSEQSGQLVKLERPVDVKALTRHMQGKSLMGSKIVQITTKEALNVIHLTLGYSKIRNLPEPRVDDMKSVMSQIIAESSLVSALLPPSKTLTKARQGGEVELVSASMDNWENHDDQSLMNGYMFIRTFFNKAIEFPIQFDEFNETMKAHTHMVGTQLCSDWPMEVVDLIESYLEHYFGVQKLINEMLKKDAERLSGTTDSAVPDPYRKRYSDPRHRFVDYLRTMDLLLEDQLKSVILYGMKLFLSLWNFELRFEQSKFIDIQPPSIFPHLFVIHLEIQNKKIVIQPPLKHVKQEILDLFRLPLKTTETVPRVDTIVFSGTREIQSKLKVKKRRKGRSESINTTDIPKEKCMNNRCGLLDRLEKAGMNSILNCLNQCFPELELISERYRPYIFVFDQDPVEEGLSMHQPVEQHLSWYRDTLEKFLNVRLSIRYVAQSKTVVAPFILNTDRITEQMSAQASLTVDGLMDQLSNYLLHTATIFKRDCETFYEQILTDPEDVSKSRQLISYLDNVDMFLEQAKERLTYMKSAYDIAFNFDLHYAQHIVDLYWECFSFPHRIQDQVPRSRLRLQDGKNRIQDLLRIDRLHLESTLNAYEVELRGYLQEPTTIGRLKTIPYKLKSLKERFDKLKPFLAKLDDRAQLIEGRNNFCPTYQQMVQDLHICEVMWTVYDKFETNHNRWLNEYYSDVDPEFIQGSTQTFLGQLEACLHQKSFEHAIHLAEHLADLIDRINEFNKSVSTLLHLRTFAIKQRDWTDLAEALATTTEELLRTKLKHLIDTDPDLLDNAVLHFS